MPAAVKNLCLNKKAIPIGRNGFFYYFFASVTAAASAGLAFFGSCGLFLPYEPIAILPFFVFLSPFPMIYNWFVYFVLTVD